MTDKKLCSFCHGKPLTARVFAATRKLRSPAYFGRLHQAYVFSAASLALNSGKVTEITYALSATEVGESVAKLVGTHKPHEAVKGNRRMIEELLPFYTFKGNLLPMKHVKENVAVALLLAALIVVAFWGIELRLLLLTVVIVLIACLAFMPAFWERIDRKKDE